ncbi:MAG: helix-turn-helix transcriptional regulator [Luteolibacter sp.]
MLYHHQQVPFARTVPPKKARIVPLFPRGGLHERPHGQTRPAQEFADSLYLRNLISHLMQARTQQGLDLRVLARKAGIRAAVIQQAEREAVIPCSNDFKAWVAALGLSWENVWSDVLDRTHAGHAA